jgi:hypothetical protein
VSFQPVPPNQSWLQEEPEFPEFNVKFDPGKFGIMPAPDWDEPDSRSLWYEQMKPKEKEGPT